MKKIYIVLTHTGTALSNVIKLYTKKDYSHASLSLDKNLEDMYSFGRLRPYNTFVAGYVKESLTSGTYKRFKNTRTAVYELEVSDIQYEKVAAFAHDLYKNKENYKFNLIGLFCVMFHKKVPRKDAYYCAEFVKEALKAGGLDVSYLPEIIKPTDFLQIPNMKLIYKGRLRKYRARMHARELQREQSVQTVPIMRRKAAV